jgi:amidase
MVIADLGQTDGSIMGPAEKNNLVGIKPTVGLTSRSLIIPISEHQDSVGPMTRTVKDAAIILQAIAGKDPADNYTSAIPNNGKIPDYVAACNPLALSGSRIGIPRNALALIASSASPEVVAFQKAVTTMRDAGATIVDANFTAATAFLTSKTEMSLLMADFIVNMATYLAQLTYNPNNLTNLADIRRFTQKSPLEAWPDRNTAVWDQALLRQKWNNTDPRFWAAYQRELYYGGEGGLLGAISRHKLDAVILPTTYAPPWAAIVGAPIITVPLGFYPPNAPVRRNPRGNLVTSGPNIP